MSMSADDFRAAIETLGMTQTGERGIDAFLNVDARNIRRWLADESRIPDAVAMLLRLMIAHRWKPDGVRLRYADSRERAD